MNTRCFLIVFLCFICCQGPDKKKNTVKNVISNSIEETPFLSGNDFAYAVAYSVPFSQRTHFTQTQKLTYICGGLSMFDTTGLLIYPKSLQKKQQTKKDIQSINRFFNLPKHHTPADNSIAMPMFKEAIVYFTKDHKPVAWINICFGCRKMCFQPENERNQLLSQQVDQSAMDSLYHLFQQLKLINKNLSQHDLDRIDHSKHP